MDMQYPLPTASGPLIITPEMAANWLEHRNKGNRAKSPRVIQRYARAMRDGRWMATHQGIAFDEEGLLLDGQHRCEAIAASGVPVQMHVFVNVPRASFSVLDQTHRRQANQLIDHPQRTTIASAARFVGHIDGTLSGIVVGGVYSQTADNDQLLSVVDGWPELLEFAQATQTAYRAAKVTPSPHLAVVVQASRTQYRDQLNSWFEGLATGADMSARDPRLILRNRFLSGSAVGGHGGNKVAFAYRLIAKAWNAHARGLGIGVLKANIDHPAPEIAT